MNYSNGKIYKLISNNTKMIYIGSTIRKLHIRFSEHKSAYKHSNKNSKYSILKILKLGDCDIILLEKFPCKTKKELHARERYWIEKLKKICVNIIHPTRTNSEYMREYRINHPDYRKPTIKCDCGVIYRKDSRARHERTQRHQKWLEVYCGVED